MVTLVQEHAYNYIDTSPNNVTLKNLSYYNNSVIRYYVNASALMIHLRKPKVITPTSHRQTHFCLLQCVFYNDYGARNTIDYVNDDVVQSNLIIEQCSFENNSDYGVSIVELKLKSQSFINTDGLKFSNNAGTGDT